MNKAIFAFAVLLSGCGISHKIGEPPELTPFSQGPEHRAMMREDIPLFHSNAVVAHTDGASLWTRGRGSLLGDRRAMKTGDILTVVIEIDDKAEFSNSSARSRSGNENMAVGALFGLPDRVPNNVSLAPAVDLSSSSKSQGQGTISRNEKLTLRVAATVVGVQPNGVLAIEGVQEVRVNNEMRQLLVSGYARPEDISRQNEITYDKIASARISYGGRGQISDFQQPRYGQQIADAALPF